jgi:hypothetical protein
VIPGSAGIAVGAVGLAAATLASSEAFRAQWLVIWLVAAAIGGCVGALCLAEGTGCSREYRLAAGMCRVYGRLLPSLFAGAVLTAVLWRAGLTRAVPGVWLLLYGCALMHVSAVASRGMAVLGALFGALALVAFGAPQSQQLAILGLGFGELHILHGVVTLRSASLTHR